MFDLSTIQPLPGNPQKVSKKALATLRKSLQEFSKMMRYRPIVYDPITRDILAGNKRYGELKALGYTEIPDDWIKSADDLTEEEKRRFIVVDNIQSGEPDYDLLAAGWDKDLLEDWGIEFPDVMDLGDDGGGEDDFHTPPGGSTTDIVVGDVFDIGKHRLMCGDATREDHVAELMAGGLADMVFTDPPYGYKYQGNHQDTHEMLLNDDKILDFMPVAYMFAKDNTPFYIFCGWQTVTEWIAQITATALSLKNLIVWKKNNWSMGDLKGAYAGQYEIILFAHKGRFEFKGGRGQDVWEFDREPPTDHPTKKPVDLIERAISDGTKKGKVVLDLFGGSGSTMVAAHQMGRVCRMMELDPKHVQTTVNRMRNLDPTLRIYKNGEEVTE